MGTNLQPLWDFVSSTGKQGLRGGEACHTAPRQPSFHPGTFFPPQERELGCVETSSFKGRTLLTVPRDPGEPTQAQVRDGRCCKIAAGSSWLKFATKPLPEA